MANFSATFEPCRCFVGEMDCVIPSQCTVVLLAKLNLGVGGSSLYLNVRCLNYRNLADYPGRI